MLQNHFRRLVRWAMACASILAAAGSSQILNPAEALAADRTVDQALIAAAASPSATSTRNAWNTLLAASGEATTISELTKLLEEREALVRIAGYRPQPGAAREFIALVQKGTGSAPILLKLERDLDELIREWHDLIIQNPREHPGGEAASEAVTRESAEKLRRGLWDPIATLFDQPQTILYALDEDLPPLPIAAFPQYDGSLLIETPWRFHQLARENELRLAARRNEPMETGICTLSHPDYDDTTVFGAALTRVDGASSAETSPFSSIPCLQAAAGDLTFAKSTGDHVVDACVDLWKKPSPWWKFWSGGDPVDFGSVIQLKGTRANERNWKSQAPSHRILILATRAFDGRSRPGCETAEAAKLCGLAMTGANHASFAEDGDEDAILFATEIRGLDLPGTDWAVLPELGNNLTGDATLLVESFLQAGCRSVLFTERAIDRRWIEPAATAAFEARFREHTSTLDAARSGHLAVLERARRDQGSSHPYYWTALRLRGSWR